MRYREIFIEILFLKPICFSHLLVQPNIQYFYKSFKKIRIKHGCQPNNKSQGQENKFYQTLGIFLLKKIANSKKLYQRPTQINAAFKNFNMNEVFVISRYIDNALLISGKKFDSRIYFLVTSYRPIKAYLYQQGFGRFCNQLYTSDVAKTDNMFVHLTKVAIQKLSEKHSDKHGKWSIKFSRFYRNGIWRRKVNKCFEDINNIIIMPFESSKM